MPEAGGAGEQRARVCNGWQWFAIVGGRNQTATAHTPSTSVPQLGQAVELFIRPYPQRAQSATMR